jgi:hypothetical protein
MNKPDQKPIILPSNIGFDKKKIIKNNNNIFNQFFLKNIKKIIQR